MVNPTELSFAASVAAGALAIIGGASALLGLIAVFVVCDVRRPAMDGFVVGVGIGTTILLTLLAVGASLIRSAAK